MRPSLGVLQMSEEASAWYLEKVQEWGLDPSALKIYPSDFEKINALMPDPSNALLTILEDELKKVVDVKHLLIPNISIHQSMDLLMEKNDYPFKLVHPIDLSIEQLKNRKINEIFLFGTRHSMKAGYISIRFEKEGIGIHFPELSDLKMIDEIRVAKYEDQLTEQQLAKFEALLLNYSSKKAVVLVCTELSMLHSKENQNVFDSARIQLEQLIKFGN